MRETMICSSLFCQNKSTTCSQQVLFLDIQKKYLDDLWFAVLEI